MATDIERIARLESQVESLMNENDQLWKANSEIRTVIYGKDAMDRTSISAQLSVLMATRAIQIWFVSIVTGIGTAIAAAYITWKLKQ